MLKGWFKRKLRTYLGIKDIEEQLDVFANDIEQHSKKIRRVKEQCNTVIDVSRELQQTSENLISQFNLSADIYPRENSSWAVISIQGRPDYVKFVNLSNLDMREISSFLRQYEKTNRTIDSPFSWKGLL